MGKKREKEERVSSFRSFSFPPRARIFWAHPRLYLNNSVWTFSFIFLFLLAPEEGLLSNRNIGQFVEYIYFLSYCYFYFFIACEQAFGRAGNWEEGKAKRPLSPLSLPYPRYFFPKQRACSSWLCRKDQFAVSYFPTSCYCNDPGLQLGDPAPLIGLLLWTCWYFIYFDKRALLIAENALSLNYE